ncbi:MAG: electron transfer flavoprotein subunit beta/FixA family protein [Candidatus Njordarchaeales archaeon]
MKILVGIKYGLKVENLVIDPRSRKVLEADTPKQMEELSKRALEEALRIKEKLGGAVTVVCIGPQEARKIITEAYAMGADDAYLITPPEAYDSYIVSKILSAFYKTKGPFDLVLLGGISTDSFTALVGSRLSGELGLPLLPMAKKIEVSEQEVVVESDLGDGTYKLRSKLPAIVTVSLEINEPRIPKLPQILKAKKKPINELKIDDLGLAGETPKVLITDTKAYEEKRKNVIWDASDPSKIPEIIENLINKLKEEGVL